MNKTKISATIVADSLSPQGDRLTSVLVTFPRIILSEINTHRMLSKNTSSSRAIPFKKMVEAVQENPFIPIAWQKYHPGMQGNEYLDETVEYDLVSFMTILNDALSNTNDEKERLKLKKRIEEKTQIIQELLSSYIHLKKTLPEWWLFARDKAVEAASILYVFDVTKQLCNRLLEPFMWTTMLITGSKEGWNNFFNLRCSVYEQWYYNDDGSQDFEIRRSRKEYISRSGYPNSIFFVRPDESRIAMLEATDLDWLQRNKGQAEIHMMALAEKIYDAMNESTPKQLQAGEWHIPFEDKITDDNILSFLKEDGDGSWGQNDYDEIKVKISTAMSAHTSYTIVGGEAVKSYEKWIELYDKLIAYDPPHSSPMEHCARAMSNEEFVSFTKSIHSTSNKVEKTNQGGLRQGEVLVNDFIVNREEHYGWCNNLKGFIPYRYFIDNNIEL